MNTHPAQQWQAACDERLLAAVRKTLADAPAGAAVGVALSAGADSAMLALHAAVAAADAGRSLHCFHIHHGLQAEADRWLAQAHDLAGLLGASCHSLRVRVDAQGLGMEAAARAARYAALASLADRAGVDHVLLAHHQDDQAETVLLRLLRGSGPLGLAAMAAVMQQGEVTYHRPWLDQPRDLILRAADRFADLSAWRPVRDPSNHDARYKRAAMRLNLAPVLDAHWPAWRRTLARHARQAGELAQWARDAAREDWLRLDPRDDDASFSLAAWRALPAARQAPVLRHWLLERGLRMPTEARLSAWLKQLREVHALGHDRQVRLRHEKHWIVVQKGRVRLISGVSDGNILKSQLE
ncbi:tRNA lysidine(34) synthetase TilS [uncultured Castellaniella sp.]|uniref:tRNA lysidine(34) synthetase TilS n=1 Tax=uncultured Castellaniella sp. TaxID=647907 RepID=UPI002610766E|nr:tRNA lysidine(34) synthetase TilS [uncultured Castellaniella sp.]